MRVYADASFIVAVYVPNAHTEEAFDLWKRLEAPALPFNPMHRLEVRNGIRQMVFQGDLDHHTAHLAMRALDHDLGHDFLHQPLNWIAVMRRAESISRAHTETTGIRAYDLFHLAAALETGHDTLLTFDERQGRTAQALGLMILGV